MKQYAVLLLPLLTSGFLTACATSGSPEVVNKPQVIQEQDIQRMAQQGKARALEARSKQPHQPRLLAGVPPRRVIEAAKARPDICPPKTPKRPVVAGGIRPHKPIVNNPKK